MRSIIEKELRNKQKEINRMFEEEGLTDEILRKQLEINQKRNEHNIVDKKEIIDDGEFVQ